MPTYIRRTNRCPLFGATLGGALRRALHTNLMFLWLILHSRGVEPSASAFADAEAPSSNRTCRFPAYGFPCETGVIGLVPLSPSG